MRPLGSSADALASRRERQPAPPAVCWGQMAEQAFASDGRHRAALPLPDSGATASSTAALACACGKKHASARLERRDARFATRAAAGAAGRLLGPDGPSKRLPRTDATARRYRFTIQERQSRRRRRWLALVGMRSSAAAPNRDTLPLPTKRKPAPTSACRLLANGPVKATVRTPSRISSRFGDRRDETLALPPEEQPVPPGACSSQANADSRFGTPTATPTDTATAAPPPRRCSTLAAPT